MTSFPQIVRRIPLVREVARGLRNLWRYIRYVRDFLNFKARSNAAKRFNVRWSDRLVCLQEAGSEHSFDRHYFYHPAWAARILAKTRPAYHVDVSSLLDFVGVLSAFVPTRYYEFRRLDLGLSDLSSNSADLLSLPFANESVSSLSCMHVVEHVGLGRYGDKIDPDSDLKAMSELSRVLAVNGSLLFVVPIGVPRVMFNGHRIYSFDQVTSYFQGLRLQEFALIPDDPAAGGLIVGATKEVADRQAYGCGCFWFVKERSLLTIRSN